MASLLILFTPLVGNAGFFGPSDYNECILESMKGVTSDLAAAAIRRSCRDKFPTSPRESKSVDLPESVLKKIVGNAGPTEDGYYKGRILNENVDWHITSLIIRITDEKTQNYRDYKVPVSILPLTKGEFLFEPYEIPKERFWFIRGGRGYRK